MSAELRQIPPAPRQARPSTLLWHRWPLLAAGLLLAVYGGMATFLLFCIAHSEHQLKDQLLDARGQTAVGTVVEVQPIGSAWFGWAQQRVHFEFVAGDAPQRSSCVVGGRELKVGSEVPIEHLDSPPYEARVVGGRLTAIPDATRGMFLVTVLPGVAMLVVWAFCALRLRRVLVHGDCTVAEVLGWSRVRPVSPGMLDVRFRFRDHRARLREGGHWIRERSILGQRIVDGADRVVVVHDRSRPWRHRLIGAQDFVDARRSAPDAAATTRRR